MLPILAALAIAVVPGERLDYGVRYGPVSIGTLTLMALEPAEATTISFIPNSLSRCTR